MKYLKSHKIFENNDDKKLKLYQLLKDMISSYDNITERYHLEGTSFGNDLAQSEDYSISPKRLVKLMDRELDQFGWEKEEIVDLVKSYEDDITDDRSEFARNYNGDWFNEQNGIIDVYLYSIIPSYPLGGTTDAMKDIDEGYIQYSYGWHRSDYGKMYVLQNYDSIEDYREETMTHFLELMMGHGRGDNIPNMPYFFTKMSEDFEKTLMDSMRRTKDTISFDKEQILESGVDEESMEEYWNKLDKYKPVDNSSSLEIVNSKETFKIHFWL